MRGLRGVRKMEIIRLRDEYIKLGQALKGLPDLWNLVWKQKK